MTSFGLESLAKTVLYQPPALTTTYSKLFFYPWRSKADIVSAPVHAWKKVIPLEKFGVNEFEISWMAINSTLLPTPNRIQRVSRTKRRKNGQISQQHRYQQYKLLFFNLCFEQWRIILVSAPSWSNGDKDLRCEESDSEDEALQKVIWGSFFAVISIFIVE